MCQWPLNNAMYRKNISAGKFETRGLKPHLVLRHKEAPDPCVRRHFRLCASRMRLRCLNRLQNKRRAPSRTS